MKVILNEDIANLGFKYEIVQVKPGFGRNYLIPQKKAILADPINLKIHEETMRQRSHKSEQIKKDAETMANNMSECIIRLPAKVSETGKIFGSVTTAQIAEALSAQGFHVDRKKIKIKDEIKTLGSYHATIAMHKDVTCEINFEVIEG